jgi:hypothetical protein
MDLPPAMCAEGLVVQRRLRKLREQRPTGQSNAFRVVPTGHDYSMSTGVAARGPLGGSENEQGGDFRADCAAHLAAHGLRGLDIEISSDVRTHGRPVLIRAEVDEDVDDLEVVFDDGRRVLLQLKKSLELTISAGKPFRKVIDQWVQQVASNPDEETPMVAVAADDIRHLADALDRMRQIPLSAAR